MRSAQHVCWRCCGVVTGDALYERRKLYVRRCYPALFNLMKERKGSLLTGTPGIGKVCDVYATGWRPDGAGRILTAMPDTPPST